jgi:molecular chaperone GrpE
MLFREYRVLMSDMKVTDRRWWAKGEGAEAPAADEPRLKPTYIEELEARLAEKNLELQQVLAKYRDASNEFDQARARLRKELSKDVERGRKSMLVSFLEVLDNLDRALEVGAGRESDALVQGVSLVRQQFIGVLESFGVTRIDPSGMPFDPARHEAVSTVPAQSPEADGLVAGVVRPGYMMGDDVLRPAAVAVSRAQAASTGL